MRTRSISKRATKLSLNQINGVKLKYHLQIDLIQTPIRMKAY
jgi:hypothetical protein